MKHRFLLAGSFSLLVAACGTPPAANTAPASTSSSTSSTTSSTTTADHRARPSCDAIDDACDAHEDKGGLPKECHDLAESAGTSEETCAARKNECLAACPK